MVNLDGYNTITTTMVIEENHIYYDWELGFLPVIPSTIKFTISDVEYEAEEGMTFGEWIESEYNTDGFTLWPESTTLIADSTQEWVITSDNGLTWMYTEDVIDPNATYSLWDYGELPAV